MAVLRLDNVTKSFGERLVLTGASAEFAPGEVVGLIGANGSGKTTLLRMLAGQLQPDTGASTRSRGLHVGYLTQHPEIDRARTVFDEVAEAFDELRQLEHRQHRVSEQMEVTAPGPQLDALLQEYDRVHTQFLAAGGYAFETRLGEVLGGLGFQPSDYDTLVGRLSGGQQCRVALAKLLLDEANFLLLDEPTNHLDLEAVRWLERFLAGHKGGAIIVSHDRYLLDRTVSRIVELDRGRLNSFPGNYSNYVKTRDVRRLTADRQFEQDQAFIAKERAFIARHIGSQRTAEAKGRRTRLERRIAAGEFVSERSADRREASFNFDGDAPRTGSVLAVRDLSKSFGDKHLFSDVSLDLTADGRLAILGANGAGKSTLLRILKGEIEADAGEIEFGPGVQVGWFSQDTGADFGPEPMVELVRAVRPDLNEQQVRAQLGKMLFTGDDAFKTVDQMSGGERARLRLLCLMLERPNVLVLDEPTNHLDIAAREALESALQEFPGAVLVVSHDRYFVDRVAQRVLVLRDGGGEAFAGNYTFFVEQTEAQALRESNRKTTRGKKRQAGASSAPKAKDPYAKVGLEALEAMILERETRLGEIEIAFGEEATYRDPDAADALQTELAELSSELEALHAAWDRRVMAEG